MLIGLIQRFKRGRGNEKSGMLPVEATLEPLIGHAPKTDLGGAWLIIL
jgi:hypothetical protein